MKKLLIAAFAASSICAFADPTAINSINFDSESLAVDTAAVDITEGDDKYFKADGADVSAVKAYDEEKPAPTKKTKFFESAGSKYLNLETEGGTLWRTINPLTQVADSTEYEDPQEEEVESQVYLDTLVQFTATEDDVNSDSLGENAKFALWLYKGEDDETAQLKIMAGDAYGIDNNEVSPAPKMVSYALKFADSSAGAIEAGTWYRLTIKAVPLLTDENNWLQSILAFKIYIDGKEMVKDGEGVLVGEEENVTLTEMTQETLDACAEILTATEKAILTDVMNGKMFLATSTSVSLSEVGFKGTGAIDSIAWTADEIMEENVPADTEIKIEVATGTEVSVQIADLVTAGFVAEGATAADAIAAFTETKTTVGNNKIAAWQAYYLGLYDPASEDKSVKDVEIDSITFDANGNVVVTMKGTPVADAPVAITYTLKKCADIANPSWTNAGSTTDPNAIQTDKGTDDQSFYKVEVSFGAKPPVAE